MPSDSYYPETGMDEESKSSMSDGAESEQPESSTALIPKSLLAGKEFNVGDEVVFKIVHMYDDDQVEIEYATGEEGDKEPEKKSMNESMDDMDKMMGG